MLETERDDAVKTAESCARTSVRLEEMVQLLDKLALEKIKEGDEDGARQVLKEKASTGDVLQRTNARAQVNYTLASKLADKIGMVQRQLVDILSPAGGSDGGSSAAQQPQPASPQPTSSASTTAASSSTFSGSGSGAAGGYGYGSSSYGAGGGAFGGGYVPRKPSWEQSIEAARERIRSAEQFAAAEGLRANRQARESVEAARERLRQQALESVANAQRRVRAKATESIAEARARIAAEDSAVLAKVQALMARYRSGEYVSEDELEWAFRQLERRFVV